MTTTARCPLPVQACTALAAALGTLVVMPPTAAHAAAGPLSAADSDFVTKVHLAASFAVSASKLAEKSRTSKIRTIGTKVAQQDAQLESLVRGAATRLQRNLPAALPSDPAAASLKQLTTAAGETFDAAYIDRLHSTDGGLLQVAAAVRVNTRNEIVRDLAQRTGTIVMAQLPLLESSGLIDLAALPTALPSASTAPTGSGPNADASLLERAHEGDGFLWPSIRVALFVLACALAGAVVMGRRLFAMSARARARGSGRHR